MNATRDESLQARQRIDALLDELLDLPPIARAARLAALSGEPEIVAALQPLLAVPDDFLQRRVAAPAEYSSLAAGAEVGAFRVVRLIGRGGMGEVYLAERRDPAFAQQAALKLLRPEAVARVEHFHNERRILAALEHPGIARLVDGGIAPDGRPYMAMEYVDGEDLPAYCRHRRLDLPARLALFRQVCAAVSYAHQHLIVHRDLKPANIHVTHDGQVKLLDFGIAKLLAEHADDGARTQALLTPDYAAPEQLEGRLPTTATDVYALGAVLYELLAGRAPWHGGASLPALMRRIDHAVPDAPSAVAARQDGAPLPARLLRGDLDAIVLKTLRPEPERRYDSAAALAADLDRHLALQPVLARGGSWRYRLRRTLRRHWLPLAFSAALFVSITGGLIAALVYARAEQRAKADAEQETKRVRAVLDYLQYMFRDVSADRSGQPVDVREVLEKGARNLTQSFGDDPQGQAAALRAIADFYLVIGDYAAAAPLLEQLLDSLRGQPMDHGQAKDRLDLATAQMNLRQFDPARANIEAAIAFWRAAADEHALLPAIDIDAKILWEMNRHEDALRAFREAAGLSERVEGANALATASHLSVLAFRVLETEGAAAALPLAQRAWKIVVDGDNRNTVMGLSVANAYAVILSDAGQKAEAVAQLRGAIEVMQALYGPSPRMAALFVNMTDIQIEIGQLREALAGIDEIGARLDRAGKPLAPDSEAAVRLSLLRARALLRLGEVDAGVAALRRALPAVRKTFSEGSRVGLFAGSVEVEALIARRQWTAARAAFARLQRDRDATWDHRSPEPREYALFRRQLQIP